MSILQAIREKGAVIVIAVIGISLIAFILMDSMSSTGKLFGGGDQTTVGEVNGENIEIFDFNAKVKQLEQQFQDNGISQRNQIMQNAWDQMVAQKIVHAEFTKLGLVFTPQEMSATMFSDDAPPQLKQAFTDPETGQYDIAKAQQWWTSVRQNKNDDQRNLIIEQVIEPMQLNSLYSKYTSMIAGSIYAPTWLQEEEKSEKDSVASLNYVAIPYTTISDSTIKVSNAEIDTYLKNHKGAYQEEAGIKISYVTFSAAPSPSDSLHIKDFLKGLKPDFIADTNARFFLGRNASAVSFFDGYTPRSRLQMTVKDSIIALPDGGVFGPYLDVTHYTLAKKLDIKMLPDSIKARHILIGTVDPQTQQPLYPDSTAKRIADSIATAIKGGADFLSLEEKYSTDQAAKQTQGEMTFDIMTIQSDNFAKEFGDFLLNTKGETKKVVKTQFGYHYIEIMDKIGVEPAYKMAYMAREIIPSDSTRNAANADAVKLVATVKNVKEFDDYVAKKGLSKVDIPYMLGENDYQLGGYQDAREVIKWAWEAKVGAVSEPFFIGDDYLVVAVNQHVQNGLMDANTARPLVETTLRNKKKAEEIGKKLKDVTTLEAAATAFQAKVLTTGEDSTLTFDASIINGIGNEPKIAGAAFNRAYLTKVSPPIPGNTGVFMIKVNSLTPKSSIPEEVLKQQQTAAHGRKVQAALQQSFDGLKKIADIKDYRSKFF